ncbi:unnamed protein product [Caenorhabditis sp. 36 PRJEB53466]|nr:unnamed protein product [Caenorhabditis sp. 36 PRJEB53466]
MRQSDLPTTAVRLRRMPPARGAKTLGWFVDHSDIFDKQHQQMEQQQQQLQRRSSSASEDSKPSIPNGSTSSSSASVTTTVAASAPQHNQQQHPKKQKRYRKTLSQYGAARKEGYAASQAMSESSEDGCVVLPPPVTLTTTSGGSAPNGSTPPQEEYWFYDVATDGYYYEQNGAKGWRRRQPNAAVHKGTKDQEVAHMNVNGPSKYNHMLAQAQAAAAQAAFIQFQMQQAAQAITPPTSATPQSQQQQQQPTMRYYDPNSDGFFYEMASVDGWKRRQPNKPVSASVPAGITRPYSQRQADHQQLQMMAAAALAAAAVSSGVPVVPPPTGSSYGAALARGQFPRNTVKSDVLSMTPAPESRDSPSSSQCGDTFAELFGAGDPVFNPIQRPSALNLEQKAVSPQLENLAALFDAADLQAHGAVKMPVVTPSSQSPMKESWNSFRSCSLFSPLKPSKRVLAPAPIGPNHHQSMGTPLIDEMDDTMVMLMRDLDKLWATTPVSGFNQA